MIFYDYYGEVRSRRSRPSCRRTSSAVSYGERRRASAHRPVSVRLHAGSDRDAPEPVRRAARRSGGPSALRLRGRRGARRRFLVLGPPRGRRDGHGLPPDRHLRVSASVSNDAGVLAEQQKRCSRALSARSGFRPVAPGDPLYRGAIAHIAAVRLEITGLRAKYKLAQNRSPEVRARPRAGAAQAGTPQRRRAADALQATIDRETRR